MKKVKIANAVVLMEDYEKIKKYNVFRLPFGSFIENESVDKDYGIIIANTSNFGEFKPFMTLEEFVEKEFPPKEEYIVIGRWHLMTTGVFACDDMGVRLLGANIYSKEGEWGNVQNTLFLNFIKDYDWFWDEFKTICKPSWANYMEGKPFYGRDWEQFVLESLKGNFAYRLKVIDNLLEFGDKIPAQLIGKLGFSLVQLYAFEEDGVFLNRKSEIVEYSKRMDPELPKAMRMALYGKPEKRNAELLIKILKKFGINWGLKEADDTNNVWYSDRNIIYRVKDYFIRIKYFTYFTEIHTGKLVPIENNLGSILAYIEKVKREYINTDDIELRNSGIEDLLTTLIVKYPDDFAVRGHCIYDEKNKIRIKFILSNHGYFYFIEPIK